MISRGLEKLKEACDQTEVKDLLGFCKDFFEQSIYDMKNGNIDSSLINLVQLNKQAERCLAFTFCLESIFVLTQVLILCDVLLQSSLQSEKGNSEIGVFLVFKS